MKKFLSLLLALTMLFSVATAATAADEYDTMLISDSEAEVTTEFTDISTHWASAVIRDLAKAGYVNGMGDGTFAPDSQVTRAQFIKMATELFDEEINGYQLGYGDVESTQWFAPYIQKADCLALIVDGMKIDNLILPDNPITREEAATIAARVAEAKKADKEDIEINFSDDADISGWAYEDVKSAASYGIIKGYDTGDYKPKATITRAEAAQILLRLIEIDTRMQIYVDSENGNDENIGTSTEPLKTIEAARDLASNYAKDMENDISILLRGKFKLSDTLTFTSENSGQNGFRFVYTSWGSEKPVITMADEYTDFKLHDESKNIWKVYVGEGKNTRQAYFNDVRGVRARTNGYLKNAEYKEKSYYLCDNEELLTLKYPTEVDMVFHINWCNPRYLIGSIEKTEEGRVKITPNEYFVKNHARIDTAGAKRQDSTPGYLENAYEFLNEAGEWYMNSHDGFMYYIPRKGEDMSAMTLKFPAGEETIVADGTADAPVSNLTFDNICFEGTTWMYVDENGGLHDCQNAHIREDSDCAPGAAIHFEYCEGINFTNNTVRQMGKTAVEFMEGSKYINILGNEIYDISGVGLTIDNFELGGSPEQRPQETWCEGIIVKNNYVHDIGRDYKSASAISLAWPRNSEFNHNEIANAPYCGFHVGYGWGNYAKTGTILYGVEINYNYIHDIFNDRIYDGAGIYTLGASSLECDQTDTNRNNKIFGNYIKNSWNCTSIYPDQGSRSWYVRDNVLDQSDVKFIEYNLLSGTLTIPWASHMHSTDIKWMTYENNYATCDYGTRNERESNIEPLNILTPGDYANWPDEAKTIMASAGIEEEYRDNFEFSTDVYIGSDDRRQSLSLETPTFSGLHIQDHEGNNIDLSTVDMELWVDDTDALELTDDGYFIAHKAGLVEAEIAIHAGGKTFLYHYRLECGDDIERLGLNIDYVNIVQGATVSLSAMAYTTFENSIDITAEAEVDLKPDDDFITVEKAQRGTSLLYDIKITPLTLEPCETVVRGTIKYGDFVQDVEIPVKIIKYDSDEGATLPFTKVNFATGWMSPGTKTEDGGYKVGGKPNFNTQVFENQLIAFDMQIDAGNSWPGFSICDSDPMSDYTKNDCYMISFKSEFVEVQKFNEGKRTVIFGDKIGSARPIGGPGIPNVDGAVLEYGKRYSVVVGALETEEGTRIILNLNGKNIMDFTDGNSDRLAAHGHFATYNPTTSNGGTTYWEYSGITE